MDVRGLRECVWMNRRVGIEIGVSSILIRCSPHVADEGRDGDLFGVPYEVHLFVVAACEGSRYECVSLQDWALCGMDEHWQKCRHLSSNNNNPGLIV